MVKQCKIMSSINWDLRTKITKQNIKQKIEKLKTSVSQAPIMEAKQLYLKILIDRSLPNGKSWDFKHCDFTEGRLV